MHNTILVAGAQAESSMVCGLEDFCWVFWSALRSSGCCLLLTLGQIKEYLRLGSIMWYYQLPISGFWWYVLKTVFTNIFIAPYIPYMPLVFAICSSLATDSYRLLSAVDLVASFKPPNIFISQVQTFQTGNGKSQINENNQQKRSFLQCPDIPPGHSEDSSQGLLHLRKHLLVLLLGINKCPPVDLIPVVTPWNRRLCFLLLPWKLVPQFWDLQATCQMFHGFELQYSCLFGLSPLSRLLQPHMAFSHTCIPCGYCLLSLIHFFKGIAPAPILLLEG